MSGPFDKYWEERQIARLYRDRISQDEVLRVTGAIAAMDESPPIPKSASGPSTRRWFRDGWRAMRDRAELAIITQYVMAGGPFEELLASYGQNAAEAKCLLYLFALRRAIEAGIWTPDGQVQEFTQHKDGKGV